RRSYARYLSRASTLVLLLYSSPVFLSFFSYQTATTEISTLSLHDALPIFSARLDAVPRHQHRLDRHPGGRLRELPERARAARHGDRKSTRLNSSHGSISYAVFCLTKKKLENRMSITS